MSSSTTVPSRQTNKNPKQSLWHAIQSHPKTTTTTARRRRQQQEKPLPKTHDSSSSSSSSSSLSDGLHPLPNHNNKRKTTNQANQNHDPNQQDDPLKQDNTNTPTPNNNNNHNNNTYYMPAPPRTKSNVQARETVDAHRRHELRQRIHVELIQPLKSLLQELEEQATVVLPQTWQVHSDRARARHAELQDNRTGVLLSLRKRYKVHWQLHQGVPQAMAYVQDQIKQLKHASSTKTSLPSSALQRLLTTGNLARWQQRAAQLWHHPEESSSFAMPTDDELMQAFLQEEPEQACQTKEQHS